MASQTAAPDDSHEFERSLGFEDKALVALFGRLPAAVVRPWLDQRRNEALYHKGVDYFLERGVQVDFKVERHAETPNCAAELISSDRPWLKPGWLYTSESHWIIHYFEKQGVLLCLPTCHYQAHVLSRVQSGLAAAESTSVRNGPALPAPLKFYSWCMLLAADEALLSIPGAFWCRLPGAHTNVLVTRAAEQVDNAPRAAENEHIRSREVPLSWLSMTLQAWAEKATPISHAKRLMKDAYAKLLPFDRCARRHKCDYISAPWLTS